MTRPDVTCDIECGDLRSAKSRLIAYLIETGYDPGLCAEIGDLCRGMLDSAEAGRWYFVSDRSSDEVAIEIDAFVAKHGGRPKSVLKQIPPIAKLENMNAYPDAVQDRFRAAGVVWSPGDSHRKIAGLEEDIWDTSPRLLAIRLGCIVVFFVLLALLIVGLRAVFVWIRSALGIP